MPILSFDYSDSASRFRILVNGFADRSSFASFCEARSSIEARSADHLSFELFDAHDRLFVWARQRRSKRVHVRRQQEASHERDSLHRA